MSSPVRKILDEIYKLPREDRALIRAELEESEQDAEPQEVELAWQDEVARRIQGLKNGSAEIHEHDAVMLELEEIVKR
ncbi:MAG TPA: hypothetical protein VFX59_16120 [Polyangiales bacterium]|nr:hypothetical protein [Polyangiales bacterium]